MKCEWGYSFTTFNCEKISNSKNRENMINFHILSTQTLYQLLEFCHISFLSPVCVFQQEWHWEDSIWEETADVTTLFYYVIQHVTGTWTFSNITTIIKIRNTSHEFNSIIYHTVHTQNFTNWPSKVTLWQSLLNFPSISCPQIISLLFSKLDLSLSFHLWRFVVQAKLL